jgi:hypothetical protein
MTPERFSARRTTLGASDTAAIFGLDPWKSEIDLWLYKTQGVEHGSAGEAAEIGNMVEFGLILWAIDELGLRPYGTHEQLPGTRGVLSATLDCQLPAVNCIIEAKSGNGQDWGPVSLGLEAVPAQFQIQIAHQAYVFPKTQLVAIPLLTASGGFLERRLYRITRRELEPLIDAVVPVAEAWWQRHVVEGERPEGSPRLDTLERLFRAPRGTATIPNDIMSEWVAARIARLAEEKREEEAKRAVLAAAGNAEILVSEIGTATYYRSSPGAPRVLRFKGD